MLAKSLSFSWVPSRITGLKELCSCSKTSPALFWKAAPSPASLPPDLSIFLDRRPIVRVSDREIFLGKAVFLMPARLLTKL